MTVYCDQCDQELAEYRLCQVIHAPLTGSYEEEIGELEQQRDRLLNACKRAYTAIKSLPEDALGRDPLEGYPYRDELLAELDGLISDGNGEDK